MLVKSGSNFFLPLRQQLGRIGFATVWLLVLSTVALCGDVFLAFTTVTTWLAQSYPSVLGEITHSEIRRDQLAANFDEVPDVRFRYSVHEKELTGDRLHFFRFHQKRGSRATFLVEKYPVGQSVEVFYNPADPSDSALDRTLGGGVLYLMLYLLPFNLIMVGSGVWIGRRVAGLRSLPLRREADCWCVLRTNGQPWTVAFIVAVMGFFPAIVVVAIGDWSDNLIALSAIWSVLIGLTAFFFWHTRTLVARDPPVLILKDDRNVVIWPSSGNMPAFSLPRSRLLGVEIDDSAPSAAAGSSLDFSILVRFMDDDGRPTTRFVLKTNSGIEATLLAEWLEDWAKLSTAST